MKVLKINFSFLLILLLFACSKNEGENNSSSFFKVIESNGPYTSRNILELEDGSLIFASVASLNVNFSESYFPAPELPSIISKYNATGDLLWKLESPEIVHVIWHILKLKNGNIAVTGFNSDDNSSDIGILILSSEGEILKQNSYFNITNEFPVYLENPMNCIELSNGNLALVNTSSNIFSTYVAVRLVILNPELNMVYEKVYPSDSILQDLSPVQMGIKEDQLGNLLIHGRGMNNLFYDTLYNFAFSFKLRAGNYEALQSQSFVSDVDQSPSDFALSPSENMVWASSSSENANPNFNPWFNFRNQELFVIGNKTTVWMTDGDHANTRQTEFSNYPKNGYIRKVLACSSGGYILLGTCNINSNQDIASDYKIMMVKLNSSLEQQWISFPNKNSTGIAQDIIETSTGYIISGTHRSFGEENRPIIFKTDKNGKIK